ncbi:hypothetical protein HK100_010072 [Physocladia obscura]|uniref:Uncharacterized protein n=1 Tax=Physocladia obscura TaxID=109957 RepID=A0AAD5XJ09_9FUNG|nr:hypothetical protein HK100_010072 [Physocladia obscura]
MLILGSISINDPVAAAFSNLVIVCLFGLNLNLALEQWIQITSNMNAKMIYSGFYCLFVGLVVATVALFSSSPTTDSFRPLSQPQRGIWLIVVPAISYLGSVVLMIVFYSSTYQYSTKKLADRPALVSFFVTNMENDIDDEMVESLHQKLQRQILFKCIGLSSSLIISYVPLLIYGVAVTLNANTANNSTFFDSVALIMSFDVILTPTMVLFFSREMRDYIVPF